MIASSAAPIPVLYLNPHGERAGAERVLDALIRGHREQDPPRFAPRVLCGSEGRFSEQLREDGVPVEVRPLRLRRVVDAVLWLRRYLREHGIRLIHTTMAHYHQFAWLASRGLGVRTLWFNHGPCSPNWWKGIAHCFPADATVVEGEFMKRRHRGATFGPRPRVIAYGIEEKWLRPQPQMRAAQRRRWDVADHEIAVGVLGRIEGWKRQHLFLRALAALPPSVLDRCRFFVGGVPCLGVGAEYARALEAEYQRHPLRDRICFTGFVDAEAFWEAMDVAVHCAHEDPFPLVVLEAKAKGKVVIGADSGGVLEMIKHGVDGFLADPTDAQAFADRIADCVVRCDYLDELRRRARESIAERFHTRRLVADFEALYSELLK
jgi:glycosyltransferase involved in cell wall biosynthesis